MTALNHSLNSVPRFNGQRPRVAVVGAGIVGLAHAWAAAKRGWEVILIERNRQAQGASIRNFGMVWPIGQEHGQLYRTAVESRGYWLELARETGLWARPCGALHLAYRDDELAVLDEFAQMAPAFDYDCRLIPPQEALKMSAAAKSEGLLAALWSPTEVCVDPREIIREMPSWLEQRWNVELRFDSPVEKVDRHGVTLADGGRVAADRVVVAAGTDFRLLYPDLFAEANFRQCKLQMMRTPVQPRGWTLGPMLAGGLTLRHYEAFAECPSLPALKARVASETPELDKYGIHVMASQNGLGEVVLGDSHEYDAEITPFDKRDIDELMLRELRRMIDLPDWTIEQRWHGIYPKSPGLIQYENQPEPNVEVVIASGGCGMTMSFGFAHRLWDRWDPLDARLRTTANGTVESPA
ncbi:TIGR03364 family FAD-dependent oxidoreductase [Lacipirellula sp.]|uniref:TIGR03364 family FAD-dependent oxidoreductase n=1 Tax=Lacipirellula sp. TaxID=2691419 RepID=UPI003D123291